MCINVILHCGHLNCIHKPYANAQTKPTATPSSQDDEPKSSSVPMSIRYKGFLNNTFSFRVLPLERTFSNTRVIISKLGGVYEDIRKSPNMFARRLRIPAARGPLFEYLLMQRARVLKISTLKASEKEKHIILKIYHKLQRDI